MEEQGCIAATYVGADNEPTQDYPENPNGSLRAIAGLSDPTGQIFGMMPHPEAYLFPENHPQWDLQRRRGELPEAGLGLQIFTNAVQAMQATSAGK